MKMMDEKDKSLKMELLEQLMELMDESIGEQFKPKEEEEVEEEMPVDELKALAKDKMMDSDEEEVDETDLEDDEEEEEEVEDDLYSDETGMSAFEKKLNAMKRKK
jgi:hypothetical protein